MNQDKKPACNEWANYETRLVHLWIANERNTCFHWRDLAKQPLGESVTEDKFRAALVSLADEIRDGIEEECAIPKSNLAADLMNAALAEVDWHVIAQALLEDADVTAIVPAEEA